MSYPSSVSFNDPIPKWCIRCRSTQLRQTESLAFKDRQCMACGYVTPGFSLLDVGEEALKKKGRQINRAWWKFLLRNPDLILVVWAWFLSVGFLSSHAKSESLAGIIVVGVLHAIALFITFALTQLYIRKRKIEGGMVSAWRNALRSPLPLLQLAIVALIVAGVVAVVHAV